MNHCEAYLMVTSKVNKIPKDSGWQFSWDILYDKMVNVMLNGFSLILQGCERSQTKNDEKQRKIWVKCQIQAESKRKSFNFDSAEYLKKKKKRKLAGKKKKISNPWYDSCG